MPKKVQDACNKFDAMIKEMSESNRKDNERDEKLRVFYIMGLIVLSPILIPLVVCFVLLGFLFG